MLQGLLLKDLIIIAVGFFLLMLWMVIFILGRRHDSLFRILDEKEYPLKDVYFTGYFIMECIHYRYRSVKDRKLRHGLEILYGKKYADFYLRVIYAQKVTYSVLLILLGFVFYEFSSDITIGILFIMFSGLAYYYYGNTVFWKIEKRSEQMAGDFSEVISKLALLTNAGMILREAWVEVAYAGETTLYQEMQKAVEEMKNGMSETDAIRLFGIRCMTPEIKKFSSTIVQGIQQGNRELAVMLQGQSSEVWELRKHTIRRKGEKAAGKLLFPIFLIFAGILIMILVPIFTNLGV